MSSKKIIAINLIFVLIMSLSGIYFGIIGNSSSVLTDGMVSLVIFLSSSLGIYIHAALNHNNDYLYPFGKWRFEYIYNFIRLIIILIIIAYSLFEAGISIYQYINNPYYATSISFDSIILYFPIKLITASISLLWLKSHKADLDDEYYQVERDSVFVDFILTVAIFLGFTFISKIDSIAEIADSITLIIISFILLITIFEELKHLILIIIGKRIYTDLEYKLADALINQHFVIEDIHIEKFGIVYIVFVTCSFEGMKSLKQIEHFESQVGDKLALNNINRYRIELNFKS